MRVSIKTAAAVILASAVLRLLVPGVSRAVSGELWSFVQRNEDYGSVIQALGRGSGEYGLREAVSSILTPKQSGTESETEQP